MSRSLADWFRRKQLQRREPVGFADEVATIPARTIGVYGTVHTTGGDIDTSPPNAIDFDCELIIFYFPIEVVPFNCSLESFTIHLGVVNVELGMMTTQKVRKGDRLTIVQRISMEMMFPKPGSEAPEWANA